MGEQGCQIESPVAIEWGANGRDDASREWLNH